MRFDLIPRVIVKLILPFIPLFALYVQFHGEYGPGGGFQAGVISASALILYAIIFGTEDAKRVAPQWLVERLMPLGVLIFAGAGLPALFQDRNFLDYAVFSSDPAVGHSWGIIIVEVGVLITVSSTILALFYTFTDRGRE
jgi:multicomponent Na+:H+ antiporter subunit B